MSLLAALLTAAALAGVDRPTPLARCPAASLPAYAHNDYANARPLAEAIERGYRGVEVDVFLVDGVLRVGHDRRSATRAPTLEAAYLEPLRRVLDECGTLTADGRQFFLALEIKERSRPTYDSLTALMTRHASLVTAPADPASRRAPVLAVLVGWHPPLGEMRREGTRLFSVQQRVTSAQPEELPPLDDRVRLVSLDYGKTMGRWWVSAAGRRRWLDGLRGIRAVAAGRLIRVHDVPADSAIYRRLLDAGVDLIGTKELARTELLLRSPR